MPSGVYTRKPSKLRDEAMRKNFAKGHTKEVRAKAKEAVILNAQNPEWREKVSKATKEAMHRPEVREKHLKGLEKARQKHGVNFKGGNGQEPTEIIQYLASILEPQGFVREYPVKTKRRTHNFLNVPDVYKIDFANPEVMVAIEVDGTCHKSKEQKAKDHKKSETLKALGWTVLRFSH